MKKVILAMAFAGLFVVNATPVYATGLVTIPAAGFSGTAYKECFALGQTSTNPLNNYGSAGTATATTTANNECAAKTYGVRSCIATFLILDSRHGQTTTHRV